MERIKGIVMSDEIGYLFNFKEIGRRKIIEESVDSDGRFSDAIRVDWKLK